MQINSALSSSSFSSASFRSASVRTHTIPQTPSFSPTVSETENQLRSLRKQVVLLEQSLNALKNPFPLFHYARFGGQEVQAATVSSSANLGLGSTPATSTVLQSTEEVNTTATSFSPFGPTFTGSSTSSPTLGGIYDGDNGTDTLTFQVTTGGVVGISPILQLEVRDSQAQLIETIDLNLYQADDPYTLQNGLVLSLGSGSLTANDTFTVSVSDSEGSAVNPDNPFNGTRNSNPNFEEGLGVSAGSFQVNGTTIDVFANDTLNTVLTRINQSAAGVTASFDTGNEAVFLTHNSLGATPTITVGSDTSGFLAATKLTGASSVQGQDEIPDEDKPLGNLPQFSSVQTGSFLLNNVSISIDVLSDSLNDLLTRITASAAGVTAAFNIEGQRVTLTSQDINQSLVVDSNGTGFFAAIGITDDTYAPTEGTTARNKSRTGLSRSQAQEIANTLQKVASSINTIFSFQDEKTGFGPSVAKIRTAIRTAVADVFESEGPTFRSKAGIHFNFQGNTKQVFELSLSGFSREALLSHLERDPASANTLLFGSSENGNDGLVEKFLSVAIQTQKDLNARLGLSGGIVDVFV